MTRDSAAPPTVLAVDDDSAIRDSLSIVLSEHCHVVFASDGPEALDVLSSRTVDVVLLDLLLPGMHGFEVLARIRDTRLRTPVIVLTAVCEAATVVAAMKAGAWNYVTKPWENDDLVDLVRCATNERRQNPGVLLVSDDIASLVPLQLALEGRVPVATMSVARALTSGFHADAIVLHSGRSVVQDTRAVRGRFHEAALIIVTDQLGARRVMGLNETAVDAVVGSVRAECVLPAVSAVRVVPDIPKHPGAVNAAWAFIVEHYADRLTVGEIAEAVRLSEDRLAHVFREATGLSVKDYLMRFRITVADRLLRETSDTLETISSNVGCADASTFHRAFRELRGMSPGEYRRSFRREAVDAR